MEYFKRLPEEITIDILTRVPTESIGECKSVSKSWRNLLRQPSFSQLHLRRLSNPDSDSGKLSFLALTRGEIGHGNLHYFEFNENHESTPIERIWRINYSLPFRGTRLIDSHNGLICLAGYPPRPAIIGSVCICNPITREYVLLPQVVDRFYDVWVTGFGYVSSSNEYKVVGMYNNLKEEFLEVYIYTLGSGNGWRNLGKFSTEYNPYPLHQGKFANGAIHWLSRNVEMIVAFDLAEEKFCEHLSPPPLPVDYNWDESRIGVWDGFLWFGIGEEDEFYDIWQSKRKNDNHDMKQKEEHQSFCWSRKCRVDESQLLADTKKDCVLTCVDNHLNIYDPKALTLTRLVDFKEQFCQVYPHKNTLISLKELGEEDTKIMKSVEIKGRKKP
ncbi:F-box protein DOR-like [Papaver somniferum]|uniref:F-box protein DOR-like n=1 Tax=Papaver somniferum TaxID=3469 RepID=UPI000E701207|nr:F-box protein DOR-like [Papaver somniferum]XP_026395478.1 F-box protein DOR-like [Papaver somniferum]